MNTDEIFVIYGGDPEQMAEQIARTADLADLIGDRKKRIGLKPNLVVPRPAQDGATTHPEIARGLIGYLRENGFNDITILEGSWLGASTEQAFDVCGYTRLARETGTKLVDTKKDTAKKYNCKGMEIAICNSAMNIDFMINLPVLKGHCQTLLTCALKNNKGIIPDSEKRRFHSIGLHKPIAHLNTVARNDFIVTDAFCGDPDFEEGGNPVYGGQLFAARDPVLCDAWAAAQMGFRVTEIPYIGLAQQLGVGTGNAALARVRRLSEPAASVSRAGGAGKIKRLAPYIRENGACSACYAALVSALFRMSRQELEASGEPVSIGQGFRGKKGTRGIGSCTAAFKSSCPGCPPSGAEVLAFLRK